MRALLILIAVAGFVIPTAAQQSKDAVVWLEPVKDPVSKIFWIELHIRGRDLLNAAEAMPADRYLFKPTPGDAGFASVLIGAASYVREDCAAITGQEIPELKIAESAGKKAIVTALRDSFEFCYQRLGKLRDAQLGENVHLTREMIAPRAGGIFALLEGLAMDDGRIGVYLRLNNVVTPGH